MKSPMRSVNHNDRGGGDITAVQGLGSIGVVIVWVLGVLTALGGPIEDGGTDQAFDFPTLR